MALAEMLPNCAICLKDLDGSLAALHCGHVFHVNCIQVSMQYKGVCPLCKESSKGLIELRLTSACHLKLKGTVKQATLQGFVHWRTTAIVKWTQNV